MPTDCSITTKQSITAHQYEQLMADMDSVLWEADVQPFRYTYVSEHAEQLFGYPVVQWMQPNFWHDHLHPADRDGAVTGYHRTTTEKRTHCLEYRMVAADGRIVWLRDIVSVILEGNRVSKVYGIMTDITERKQAEEERQAHLHFLESMDKINRAIQGTNDFTQMLQDVLDVTLAIFGCDRAGLLYPCEPDAATWSVPMERTRPEYPGAFVTGVETAMDADMTQTFRILRASNGPVQFGPGAAYPLPTEAAKQHKIQSAIAIALYPKVDKPYLFGLHHCAQPRLWTPQEERLFQAIGRRLVDALNSLISYRHLQESERRYREIFDTSSDVLVIAEVTTDARFKLLDVNPALCKMLGLNQDQLIGTFLEDFAQLHESAHMMLMEHRQCLVQKAPVAVEREWETSTGRWHVHFTLIPVSNDAGQIYRIVGMGRDLTAQKRAEDQLRLFLDHATDAFFLHDASGIVLDANRRACEMLGYTREELIGMSPLVFDPNLDQQAAAEMNRRLAAGQTIITERSHRRKDGSIYPIELRARPVWLNGQQFNVSLVQDITERQRVESELRASEARFRTFVDHATDGFFLQAAGGMIVDINRQACESLGYSREELMGQFPSFFDPDWTPAFAVSLRQRLNAGEIVTFESRHQRKDGSIFPVEVRVRSFTLEGRTFGLGLVRDITRRKQAAAALKESEERYRTLYEANPTMYFTVDATGTILSVNQFGAEHLGYTVAELTGHSVLDVFYEEDKVAAQIFVGRCITHPGEIFHWSLRKLHKSGALLWVEETARAVQDVNGVLVVLIVCEDITERKRTEQALIESHNLLNAIIEGTTDMTFAKDRQGRYLMMNSAGARLMGRPLAEIIGKDDRALFPPELADAVMAKDRLIMASGETQTFEETVRGSVVRTFLTTKAVHRDSNGTVNGIVAIARDITELKRLEEQFRQAQKMEAVGRLAGGVAHDFNNLLTVINGYSQLVFNRLPATDPNRPRLAEIQKAGERAASLTRQLLAFSRKQMLQPEVVNLNTLLTELLKLLQRLIGEDIELALTTAVDLGLTKIDPAQFEQAIINLAVNARDAMPQGGRLTITTCNTALDAAYAERYPELQAGAYVCVSVTDRGCGMDEATLARIFEPFFTTKDVGKGTGLGLAMVYGFVKQSGGHVEVFSEVGRGTTFRIYLPCTEEADLAVKADLVQRDIPKGNETLLLVEDEEAVRNLFCAVLCNGGYTVLSAHDGQSALELAQQHAGPIHLLITDLVMPRMSGRQLADSLHLLQPNMRILFMSGYTEEAVTQHRVQESNVAFLQKPFDPLSLAQKVRDLLDSSEK